MSSVEKPDFFLQSGSKVDLHVGSYFKTPKSKTELVYSSELVELWYKLFMIHRRKEVLTLLEVKTDGSNKRFDQQRRQLTVLRERSILSSRAFHN